MTTITEVTPAAAGWERSGLRVLSLAPGERHELVTGDAEVFVLPLAGSLRAEVVEDGSGAEPGGFDLRGRTSVFARVSDFAYVGRDSTVVLTSTGGAEVAVPSARCERRLPARYGAAEDVPVEVRGAGRATRQVTNFGVPGEWDHADRIICCEVLTPPGNWSSYPPHKHDASEPCEVVNEEIYYYRVAGRDQVTPDPAAIGYHRTYTGPEHEAAGLAPVDDLVEVRDHGVVLIPHGYHGPSMAAPDYPLYYLNVMAGPGERAMVFCDDPAHAWIRDGWADTPTDPRCPMTTAEGPVR